ncbi:glycosyltransferase family 4 protein [Cellulomonas sp. URHD0024]|uniref:glycosyltransferase family 4 protein n=1 Tax=Cellulomonas sp. URHD0024 TaxID=1302620 RepID=UPI0035109C01
MPPPAYGGTEAVIDRLARGLVAAGHEVVLAAAANSTCPVPRVPGTVSAPEDRPATGDAATELGHVVLSYAALSDMDVIHDHTLAGPLLGRPPGRPPVVTTNHGPFDEALTPLYRAMRGVAIVAISHHQASTARGVPIAAVIHHGLDVEEVPVGAGDGGYVSFVGRMCPEKGAREAALIAREAGMPLKMAAKLREPLERQYFEQEVKPLLSRDIEYLGELGEKEKLALVGGSVALLDPMQWPEPFGLVMIEALACGTPVIATPAGAAPEIVDDGVTGYLRQSSAELVAALSAAGSLDRSGCRSAVERFSTKRMVQAHVELYTKVVAAHASEPATLAPWPAPAPARTADLVEPVVAP